MKYEFTIKEYSSLTKKKIDKTYSTIADSLEKAIDNIYRTWGFKWSKDKIRELLGGDNK